MRALFVVAILGLWWSTANAGIIASDDELQTKSGGTDYYPCCKQNGLCSMPPTNPCQIPEQVGTPCTWNMNAQTQYVSANKSRNSSSQCQGQNESCYTVVHGTCQSDNNNGAGCITEDPQTNTYEGSRNVPASGDTICGS